MAKEIIANIDPLENRVAVLDQGILVNLYIERGEPLAGNIYKGRVANVLPGMEAAFVDIGLERNAFLHVGDIRSQRLAGEEVEESFGKGAIAQRLRGGQEILGEVTVRTAAEGAEEKDLTQDIQFLLQVWNRVEERSKSSRAPALVYQDLHLIRRVVRDLFTDEVERFLIDSNEEFQRVQDLLGSL